MNKNYYELLGITMTASAPAITDAFMAIRGRLQSDGRKGDGAALETLQDVMAAYRTLMNDESRAQYDALLRGETNAAVTPAQPGTSSAAIAERVEAAAAVMTSPEREHASANAPRPTGAEEGDKPIAYCPRCGVPIPKGDAYKYCPGCGANSQSTQRGKRTTRNIVIGLVAGMCLVLGAIAAAPFITVHQMKTAAANHDGAALSEHVDFPALRQSLKDQMNVFLGKKMAKEVAKGNALAALAGMFGGVIVEKMVDNYVTPTGITQLMEGQKPEGDGIGNASTQQAPSDPLSNASMGYESFSKFSVVTNNGEPGKETRFVLRRSGISWKLTEIVLPL